MYKHDCQCGAAITCPLAVASTRILLDAGGGAKNTDKVEVDLVKDLSELETKFEEKVKLDLELAKGVLERTVEKVSEVEKDVEKEIGSVVFQATSVQRNRALQSRCSPVLSPNVCPKHRCLRAPFLSLCRYARISISVSSVPPADIVHRMCPAPHP